MKQWKSGVILSLYRGIKDPNWAFNSIINFLQFQKERVQRDEITGATLRNFVKSIKLFCEMSDIPITWKKITRGLPKMRRHADDRAPTIEEIQKICEYPDRRIKGLVYTMASSGIRLGAWEYISWGHIKPIKRQGKILAAKIIVYPGDDEEYYSFITPEAYYHLEKWMIYRAECGENIDEKSWVMRQLWNTKEGRYHHGTIKDGAKLQPSGVKRLVEDSLWTQGIRSKSNLKRNRYEFQTDHGFRKWFKTRCEIAGMKSINIETLMGHSIGISDSYYRATEEELLTDYLKAVGHLTISSEHNLKKEFRQAMDKFKSNYDELNSELGHREQEIRILQQNDFSKIQSSIIEHCFDNVLISSTSVLYISKYFWLPSLGRFYGILLSISHQIAFIHVLFAMNVIDFILIRFLQRLKYPLTVGQGFFRYY